MKAVRKALGLLETNPRHHPASMKVLPDSFCRTWSGSARRPSSPWRPCSWRYGATGRCSSSHRRRSSGSGNTRWRNVSACPPPHAGSLGIERIGQKRDTVYVFNMRYRDSIEDRVHQMSGLPGGRAQLRGVEVGHPGAVPHQPPEAAGHGPAACHGTIPADSHRCAAQSRCSDQAARQPTGLLDGADRPDGESGIASKHPISNQGSLQGNLGPLLFRNPLKINMVRAAGFEPATPSV